MTISSCTRKHAVHRVFSVGIHTFAMDMHAAFANAVRADADLKHVAIVHDPFHIMKAWMFYGSDTHAEAAAALFSIIASCRQHRIDPERYLDEVFRLLPYWPAERYLELAPSRWLATRAKLDAAELERQLGAFTIPAA